MTRTQQILRSTLAFIHPPGAILEIDYSTVTVTTCPVCKSDRVAMFDVVRIDRDGVGVLTTLRRCFSCHPLDPPTR